MTGPRASAAQVSYLSRMLDELGAIELDYAVILRRSTILNIDPNRHGGGGVAFFGYPIYGWGPSEPALESARMDLLRRLSDWGPRYRLLFPHPIKTVTKRLDGSLQRLEAWLLREGRDHSVPATPEHAVTMLAKSLEDLRALSQLLPADAYEIRVAPDTNTLIDNPDLAAHTAALGPRYMAHVLPVVFGELDNLKRSGRTQDLREAAKKADRRLKGLRDNGNVRIGAKVSGNVAAVFEYVEPSNDGLPTWLDLSVPDDRFVAAALQLQSQHPGSALYVATGDLNMQNKLAAVGLPFVELP